MPDDQSESISKPVGIAGRGKDMVLIPRWVVYFQAAMLGLVATTFFVFGIMVGSVSSPVARATGVVRDHRISGTVLEDQAGGEIPAAGAVVLLLPDPPKEILRQDPETVRPDSFEPLENPSIDWIRGVGGSVVRTNNDGRFELFAVPGTYNLLIISKSQRQKNGRRSLTKDQVAAVSQYFLPVENLIQEQRFVWRPLEINSDLDLNAIVIE